MNVIASRAQRTYRAQKEEHNIKPVRGSRPRVREPVLLKRVCRGLSARIEGWEIQ